ncbi:hypothetical protein D3OALGA1CA_2897 [Olavius algarvensis associated proteobacterium Delta 3]|nr:hypothetical protein D3OALGA1CA_2897 [Olavius algarvensis associated proteobacterium Delta 3]
MVKRLQTQLNSVSKQLAELSKKVDKLNKQLGQVAAAKAPAKKAPAKKKAKSVKKAAPKKKVAKKAAPKKKPAKKAAPKKAAPKKAAAKKGATVLDSVYDAIKRSKAGVTIASLKAKTKLEARQLSNALYKLSKRGDITAKSRGVYVKK